MKTAGDVGQVMLMQANLRNASLGRRARSPAARPWSMPPASPFQRGRQSYQAVHADGARTIAEAARAAGAQRLVHISGIGADNRSSTNRYIKSKVAAEDAVITGFDSATILRPSVVFGPDDALFNRMAAIAAKAPFVPVVGDGSARVQPVFVGDVGKAAAAVLARPDTAKSVFELGGPRVYSYRELAALVLLEIDRQKPIIGMPAGLMKLAGFFAQQIARVGLIPPITADQVELMTPRQHRAARRPVAGDARHPADCGRSHPADLSRPLPDRRPLQPARSGLIDEKAASLGFLRLRPLVLIGTNYVFDLDHARDSRRSLSNSDK